MFLASKGFDVTGIDVSKEAINKFLNFSREKNVQVKGVVSDIVNFKTREKYESVICTATLHLISRDKINQVIEKIQKYTKIGGINLITVFTKKDIGHKEYPNLHFFNNNELKNIYKEWKIVLYKNYVKRETHGKPHKHHICILVARKR